MCSVCKDVGSIPSLVSSTLHLPCVNCRDPLSNTLELSGGVSEGPAASGSVGAALSTVDLFSIKRAMCMKWSHPPHRMAIIYPSVAYSCFSPRSPPDDTTDTVIRLIHQIQCVSPTPPCPPPRNSKKSKKLLRSWLPFN